MNTVLDAIPSIPIQPSTPPANLVDCAKACISAELACGAWAAVALRGANLDRLRACLSLSLDCGDICSTTGKLLARNLQSDPMVLRAQLEACARACATCGAECHRLAGAHPLSKTCAETCHRCEQACDRLVQELRAGRS
jgi:hypothetical protein